MQAGFPTGTEPEIGAAKKFTFQPPSIDELKPHFPQLEILGFIGQGGMGAVYKARQPMLDRYVALKILPPEAATGPGFTDRFTREARALARLTHPNIVAVHEFGRSRRGDEADGNRGYHYLLMEFVDGVNLREMERAGRLSPAQALSIVPKICDALQYAHDEGVVHRDIKPENILVDKKGRVKIADFGIAKILGAERQEPLTGAQHVVGTPHYMAPEQVEKPLTVDHRADIYSVGVVFYEMLTGELPLGRFAAPSKKVQIDVRLDEIVLRALEKEPEQRYQQASQFRTEIETIATPIAPPGVPASQSTDSLQQTVFQERWRQILRWGLAAVLFLDFALPHSWRGGLRLGVTQPWLFFPHDGDGFIFNGHSRSFYAGVAAMLMAVVTVLTKKRKLSFRYSRWVAVVLVVLLIFNGVRALQRHWGSGSVAEDTKLSESVAPFVTHDGTTWTFPAVTPEETNFSIGQEQFRGGDWIGVASVVRTPEKLIARGAYSLVSADVATLGLHITATNKGSSRIAPEQQMRIRKGAGTFELIDPHPQTGLPHVSMYGTDGNAFASLYFGTPEEARKERQLNFREKNDTGGGVSFGSVIERGVTEGIDIDTGKLIDLKDSATNSSFGAQIAENIRRAELAGVDAFVDGEALLGLGMDIFPVPDRLWHDAAADEIVSTLNAGMQQLVVKMEMHGHERPGTYVGSYAFKTREGSIGILQVLGVVDDPHGHGGHAVRIRYKLVGH